MTAPIVIRIRFPRRASLTVLSAAVVATAVMGAISGPPAGLGQRTAQTADGPGPVAGSDDLPRLEAWQGPDGYLGDGTGAKDRLRAQRTARVAFVAERMTGPSDNFAIPRTVLDAYQRAAKSVAASDPSCHLPWWVLAGIGRIESGHAADGRVDASGTTRGHILGPVLDGSLAGTAVIRDTDRGRLDGDRHFDRAVGPMQFVPATWAAYASDGNGDGVSSPHNVFDATLAAGRYLCAGSLDLGTDAGLARAILRYNDSDSYLKSVLAWGIAYRDGTTPTLDATGRVPAGSPRRPESTPAIRALRAALAASATGSPTSSRGPGGSRTTSQPSSTASTTTGSGSGTTGGPSSSTTGASGSPTSSSSATSSSSSSTSTTSTSSSPTSTTSTCPGQSPSSSGTSTSSTSTTSSSTGTSSTTAATDPSTTGAGPDPSCTSSPTGSATSSTADAGSSTTQPTTRTATRTGR